MTRLSTMQPPLSPVLLAGVALRPMPLILLQPILKIAMDLMIKNHGDVFERLSVLDNPRFLIDPLDLPFVFILDPGCSRPQLTARLADENIDTTATIRGPLSALIELLEGRTDGDALFFNRTLRVEGDTEAVLTLRNAIDGADINLVEEILTRLGPLKRPVRWCHAGGVALAGRAVKDIEVLRNAVIAPAIKRADQAAAKMRRMDEKISKLQKENNLLAKQVARKLK